MNYKDIQTYLALFIIITAFGVLYNRWEQKNLEVENKNTNHHIRQFLLNKDISNEFDINSKPFLWIHVENELNSRNWESFNSRSNREVNKPYMFYSIKSVIKKCDKTFNICLIDDESFGKLISDWNIDLKRIDITARNKIRTIALTKILYAYGGILVPSSFLCNKNLKQLYYKNINNKGMFTCEKLDKTSYITHTRYIPDLTFMGCKRNNKIMKEFLTYLETMISDDFTSESDFKDSACKYLSNLTNEKKITMMDGKMIGIKDINDKKVSLEDLFNTHYIEFPEEFYGIYIPDKELTKRTNYNWFLKLNVKQLLESDMIISKYMLTSND